MSKQKLQLNMRYKKVQQLKQLHLFLQQLQIQNTNLKLNNLHYKQQQLMLRMPHKQFQKYKIQQLNKLLNMQNQLKQRKLYIHWQQINNILNYKMLLLVPFSMMIILQDMQYKLLQLLNSNQMNKQYLKQQMNKLQILMDIINMSFLKNRILKQHILQRKQQLNLNMKHMWIHQ